LFGADVFLVDEPFPDELITDRYRDLLAETEFFVVAAARLSRRLDNYTQKFFFSCS
jgi:hypothetical protein